MSDTTFVNGSTLSDADWFNDLNRLHYTILADPATLAAAKDSLFPAWTTPSFSAGDYTGGNSQTWTVASGDVATFAYIINGKMMTVAFTLNTTTVGGTPDTDLKVVIPASKTATKGMRNSIQILDNGTRTSGVAVVDASGTSIIFQRADGAVFTASTNQTYILGQITFEIN